MISVIVPVYNNPSGIRATVNSVTMQTSHYVYNLCLVDNNSTDITSQVLQSFADDNTSITYKTELSVQSSYAARNTGIRHTESDIIAFLDADITVPEGWLDAAIGAFNEAGADYMGTDVSLVSPDWPSLPARYDRHTGFPVKYYLAEQHFAPTCCLFVRREVFQDVGLFDPRLTSGGDKEFGNRVHDAGYDMHFAEDVTVNHPTRNTIRDLVSKDLRVGRGLCQLQRYHPERYGRPGVPPRPSGAKSPGPTLSLKERLAFGALGTFLTGVRGIGYYRELFSPTPAPDIGNIPTLD